MMGLSQSALGLFKECPRCFWLAKVEKVERPRSPMPSIVNSVDGLMKKAVDKSIAMMLETPFGVPKGLWPMKDRKKVEQFRSWRTFQTVEEFRGMKIKLWGEIDDVLDDGQQVTPWDFKSKGSAPEEGYCEKYNQAQADVYHLLLDGQGLVASGRAVFSYGWPELKKDGSLGFAYESVVLATSPMNALQLAYDAAVCLDGPMPEGTVECKYCAYALGAREVIERHVGIH